MPGTASTFPYNFFSMHIDGTTDLSIRAIRSGERRKLCEFTMLCHMQQGVFPWGTNYVMLVAFELYILEESIQGVA